MNTASQNTLDSPLLTRYPGYLLGTDFKAGQTKFKTQVLEYVRQNGWEPNTVASCNHLGNWDVGNLDGRPDAMKAKMKKKHDIFAPWEEPSLDHKVSVLYTPTMNDSKRDYVEYTSTCFLQSTHTMVTHTRASDSCLCAPLMIDTCVLLEYFWRRQHPKKGVARATSYLFKVPDSPDLADRDPGFSHQMSALRSELESALATRHRSSSFSSPSRVTILDPSQSIPTKALHVPNRPSVICAGLACLDTMLLGCERGQDPEAINAFEGAVESPGGSVR